VTEQDHPGGAVQEQGEVLEWVELDEEEWAAPERVQVQMENVLVLNVEQLSLMKWVSPATIGNVPNVERR
jgi:hypothetical protein